MTALREAAQQALDALESAEVDPHSSDAVYKAITALRAALAEPVQQGCDHCNQPLYAATRCRVCGRVTEAKPVQEPVAWLWPHQLAELQEWKNEGNIRAWSGKHYKPDGVVPVYTKPQGGSDE